MVVSERHLERGTRNQRFLVVSTLACLPRSSNPCEAVFCCPANKGAPARGELHGHVVEVNLSQRRHQKSFAASEAALASDLHKISPDAEMDYVHSKRICIQEDWWCYQVATTVPPVFCGDLQTHVES